MLTFNTGTAVQISRRWSRTYDGVQAAWICEEVPSCLDSGTQDPDIPGGSTARSDRMGHKAQCQSTSTRTSDTSMTTRGAGTRATGMAGTGTTYGAHDTGTAGTRADGTGTAHTGTAHTGTAHTGTAHTGTAHTSTDTGMHTVQPPRQKELCTSTGDGSPYA